MKVVLAYSGGLDTTVLLTWLQEKYDAEVICYCANVGQEDELDGLEQKQLLMEQKNVMSMMFKKNLSMSTYFQCFKQMLFMKEHIY